MSIILNENVRAIEEVIIDIKSLVRSQGYIYPLLLIIFEDFHVDPENLHQMDNYSRLNMNEASLLVGFFFQEKIDFTIPESFEYLFFLKKRTYELMDELHKAFHKPFINGRFPQMSVKFQPESGCIKLLKHVLSFLQTLPELAFLNSSEDCSYYSDHASG